MWSVPVSPQAFSGVVDQLRARNGVIDAVGLLRYPDGN
jgi:hypothetical protein